MSVTKIRLSGLFAINRTRFRPSTATLMANPSGMFRLNDLPVASEIRWGTSLDLDRDVEPAVIGSALKDRTTVTRAMSTDTVLNITVVTVAKISRGKPSRLAKLLHDESDGSVRPQFAG